MTLTIGLFWVVLMLIVLVVVSEHFMNWWARKIKDDLLQTVFIVVYVIKWFLTIAIFHYLLK
jgi:hypothetical protein